MQSLLLQIVKELHRIEERIIDILMNVESVEGGQTPAPTIQEEQQAPVSAQQENRDLKDSRIIWKSKEEFVDVFGIADEYEEIVPNIGIAYKKDVWSREEAWKSATRAWTWMANRGDVPNEVRFNALRKLHTEDWYIWFYDTELAKNKWVSARIKAQREE
jgi:hypothetical protein